MTVLISRIAYNEGEYESVAVDGRIKLALNARVVERAIDKKRTPLP
tara:strand:- start:6018 stop:6155 length:138 start_codon:yes stop_codon:yes gene_type:complete